MWFAEAIAQSLGDFRVIDKITDLFITLQFARVAALRMVAVIMFANFICRTCHFYPLYSVH